MSAGLDYCGPEKTSHKVFFGYVGKINKRVARNVSSCYEE